MRHVNNLEAVKKRVLRQIAREIARSRKKLPKTGRVFAFGDNGIKVRITYEN